MPRRNLPAPGTVAVKAALDGVRVTLRDIGGWLRTASPSGNALSPSSLNNYRHGRREMPPGMRRLLARQLREHARRLGSIARQLDGAP